MTEGKAQAAVAASLERAEATRHLNALTAVLPERAAARACAVDSAPPDGALSGMTFVAKDLFDIAGRVTNAGSRIALDDPPAARDATAVARLEAAGAVLVGTANMDEFAYGFSTENAHYGATRNPHDPERIAGGSSGGSAAAVAAGIVPVSLGSDTNGSIRVPASLCGIYGLKPTFGRLSRAGTYPFVASLDHIGPFARDVALLAHAYDALQGPDPLDHACADRPAEPVSTALESSDPPRVGVLQGWFRRGATEQALAAVDHVASAFPDVRAVALEGAEVARSAAFCMSAAEGGSFHRERLRTRAMDFDPAVRDRLLAGLMVPANVLMQVRRARRRFKEEADALFGEVDLLLAPATPCSAPLVGQATMVIDGAEVPVRANLGLYTQPISFIGLPVIAVPVRLPGLPIGVQLIGPAWGEATLFRAARWLEARGIVGATA